LVYDLVNLPIQHIQVIVLMKAIMMILALSILCFINDISSKENP